MFSWRCLSVTYSATKARAQGRVVAAGPFNCTHETYYLCQIVQHLGYWWPEVRGDPKWWWMHTHTHTHTHTQCTIHRIEHMQSMRPHIIHTDHMAHNISHTCKSWGPTLYTQTIWLTTYHTFIRTYDILLNICKSHNILCIHKTWDIHNLAHNNQGST